MGSLIETANLIRLFPDFGCLVLALIVQLTIYPSFLFYQKDDLFKWHPIYTRRISYIVIPLMLSQILLNAICCYVDPSLLNILVMTLITTIWVITFFIAVPYHDNIRDNDFKISIVGLIKINFWRCMLWGIVLLINGWNHYLLS